MELMEKVAKAIKQVNDKLNFNEVIQNEESILMLFRETMLKIYDFGFEVCGSSSINLIWSFIKIRNYLC